MLFANQAGSHRARVCVKVMRAGVIMQLARKRDALMPPNPEELLNRPHLARLSPVYLRRLLRNRRLHKYAHKNLAAAHWVMRQPLEDGR